MWNLVMYIKTGIKRTYRRVTSCAWQCGMYVALRSKQAELKEVVIKQKWDIVGVVDTFMGSSESGDGRFCVVWRGGQQVGRTGKRVWGSGYFCSRISGSVC